MACPGTPASRLARHMIIQRPYDHFDCSRSREESTVTEKSDLWANGIDPTRPSIARAYDVVLNGKDNFEVDRAFVAEIVKVVPEIYDVATYNREILGRGVRFLVGRGITQFIDLGSGLPTVENTHHVAQRANPDAQVVYVDNDPMVLAHGRAILAENDRTGVVTSGLREPKSILADE